MLPPSFVRDLQVKGANPPHYVWCIHFANDKDGFRSVCMKFGAVVFLDSSCSDFQRRVMSESPVAGKLEIKEKFRWGLNDLTR